MSTRSTIGIVRPDGSVKAIYCHWDGYPSHHVPILTEHYNTTEKVEALVALGSISELHESPAKPAGHSYDTPVKGYCIAYGRDRGEEDVEALEYPSIDECLSDMESYCYLFEKGEWKLCSASSGKLRKIPKNYENL